MAKVILRAQDLDGYLTASDRRLVEDMDRRFRSASPLFQALSDPERTGEHATATRELIELYDELGHHMKEITAVEPKLNVYSFGTPREVHGEVSRLIAKLRDVRTEQPEFVYYTQRAYELLFNFAFGGTVNGRRRTTSSCARPSQYPRRTMPSTRFPTSTRRSRTA